MLKHGSQNGTFTAGGTQTVMNTDTQTYQSPNPPTPNNKMGIHPVSASFAGVVT